MISALLVYYSLELLVIPPSIRLIAFCIISFALSALPSFHRLFLFTIKLTSASHPHRHSMLQSCTDSRNPHLHPEHPQLRYWFSSQTDMCAPL